MPRLLVFAIAASLLLSHVLTATAVAQNAESAQPRTFARGVLTTIPPELLPEETFSVHDMVEITSDQSLNWQPKLLPKSQTLYAKAQDAVFPHEIWGLELSFKPLRMVNVRLQNAQGQTQEKLLWYLVYKVTNTGERLRPVQSDEGDFSAEPADPKPVEFMPQFVLEGQDRNAGGEKIYKAYLDRVLPSAMEVIRRRETPGRQLLNSAQIATEPIEVSTESEDNSVWGVAIWEDIDPEMDFLSIFVGGLTNVHVWEDTPGEFRPGDPAGKGRQIAAKTLQLNFWRPGDEYLQNEREIRYGVPPGRSDLYGVGEGVAYQWTFR